MSNNTVDTEIVDNPSVAPDEIRPIDAGRVIKPNGKKSNFKSSAVQLAAKGVLGAAVGVAGGLVLVTTAAVVGGAVLSWAAFATVLGVAGAAGGVSHDLVSTKNKKQN
jgi:hypothetical protein